MAKSFEDYETRRNSRSCPRCGEEVKAGAVTVRLMEFRDGQAHRFDGVASRQISMCEACCVEVYDTLVDGLDSEANGGTRKAKAATKTAPETPARARGRSRRRAA